MPSPSPDDPIFLPQYLREARENAGALGLDPEIFEGVTYNHVRNAVINGTVPAEKLGREWIIRRKHLAEVASVLGLGARRKPSRPRKASSPSNAVAAA
ncbi:hypothetical protein [Muricoccus nepalensis]|uniref:hypothetical protein n=1 Tax=Muricoccus nepalensis TaxID=1854500 RepID=UPI00112E97BF|nr:hypothetical protein [Roseomonas nepalensis]